MSWAAARGGLAARLATTYAPLALLAFGAAAITTVACDGRRKIEGAAGDHASGAGARRGAHGAVAVLDLARGAAEQDSAGLLGVGGRGASFNDLVAALDRIARSHDYRGVLVRFGDASLGLARADEIGRRLAAIREAGALVYCHGNGFGNGTLMAALRGCSRIYVAPAGEVEGVGIAAQVVYFRQLLEDQLHLSVDILQVGKFKGAEEPLTRDGPSDEARSSLEGVLEDLRESWLDAARERPNADQALAAMEDGPFAPLAAKDHGLVDDVGYADDALAALRTEAEADREEVLFGAGGSDDLEQLPSVLELLGGASKGAPVALLRASGSISMSGGGLLGGPFGGSGGITEKALSRLILKADEDDDIRAVVLRIDSPGGSALASDLLWHRLMHLRGRKPLVVSVGDMAASGGYYLACTGSTVFAEPTSIVGSIGVVGGKIAIAAALERFGVHAETFTGKPRDEAAASRAAYLSLLKGWDPKTRARVLDTMHGIYDLFLERVAAGRNMTVEAIAPHAEGRIFSGRRAKDFGLVDELGGLSEALAKARELAHLPPDAAVAVLTGRPKLLDTLTGSDDGAGGSAAARGLASAAAAPLVGELFPFVTSLAPLAGDERAVTALPFALRLH